MGNLQKAINSTNTVLVGAIHAQPNNVVPTGYLECDGQVISRTTYAELFTVIGELYGAGDTTTTFLVPDLRGEFIRGFDNGKGTDTGRAIGSGQDDAIRNITGRAGSFRTQGSASAIAGGSLYVTSAGGDNSGDGDDGSAYHVYMDASREVPTAADNRPKNIAMMYCIKY